MKISVNDQELFTLNETQKKVICNDIPTQEMQGDMERRIQYILMHKYEQCFNRLKKEWEPKLKANGVESIPLNDDAFAQLVFSQSDYKDRSQREVEAKAAMNKVGA